jgi:hypothetical protein
MKPKINSAREPTTLDILVWEVGQIVLELTGIASGLLLQQVESLSGLGLWFLAAVVVFSMTRRYYHYSRK